MTKLTRGLASLSGRLADAPWCTGNHYSLADVAVGCALGWLTFRFPEIGWRGDHPNLGRLLDKLMEQAAEQAGGEDGEAVEHRAGTKAESGGDCRARGVS